MVTKMELNLQLLDSLFLLRHLVVSLPVFYGVFIERKRNECLRRARAYVWYIRTFNKQIILITYQNMDIVEILFDVHDYANVDRLCVLFDRFKQLKKQKCTPFPFLPESITLQKISLTFVYLSELESDVGQTNEVLPVRALCPGGVDIVRSLSCELIKANRDRRIGVQTYFEYYRLLC